LDSWKFDKVFLGGFGILDFYFLEKMEAPGTFLILEIKQISVIIKVDLKMETPGTF
jgi:hypothetical protein